MFNLGVFLPRPKYVGTVAPSASSEQALGCPAGRSPAARCNDQFTPAACVALLIFLFAVPFVHASDCIPIQEASNHVGQTACVTGKVLKVKAGAGGVHFLDFCQEQIACPFSVVVFPHDLRDVGDVRRLAGKMIEIKGPVKLYDGRAEIILNRISQITGGATLIPPLPKEYDVEKQGHYSAGHMYSKKLKTAKPTPNPTATYGYDVEGAPPE